MISPGTMLGGRYRLEERIASGGMGDVWRCVDDVLGRTVAVKVLLPSLLEEQGFTERFRAEARTMATINHPGVVDIYDYGSDPAVGAYLVMEYVEGDALSRTLARVGRLTPARTMALVAQAADALHAAHERGVVHRDVKPGNLLVRPNGTLVLTDFGIARSAGAAQLTAAGSVLGTATYISPEQAMGEQATALSDIYALGVVAYQCLAGRRPFEGDNPLEIAMRHVREAPPPLPPDIPPQVRAIVERAMAKDPAARWPNAAQFAGIARRCAAELAAATPRPTAVIQPGLAPGIVPTGHPVSGGPTPVPMPMPPPPVPQPVAVRPTAPVTRPVAAPGYRPGPPVPPGYLGAPVPPPQPKQASTGLIVAIVVAVIVVAICIGATIAILQTQGNGSRALGSAARVTGWGDGATGTVRGTVGRGITLGDGVVMMEGRLGR
jgi:serine/threonine-protein kinase